MKKILKIGTRGSPLALRQTQMVEDALAQKFPDLEIQQVVIQTSGDWRPEDGETRLPANAGGKAQFAKEIEEALFAGEIDAAVHSMKDMDSHLPKGLVIDHMLPREDARDCLLFSDDLVKNNYKTIAQIPSQITVGTSSVRREAFLRQKRSDFKFQVLRGNVQTRIEKVRSGQVDGTMLAMAGLKRLGLEREADMVLSIDDMLPAAAQGAVGIEVREEDEEALSIFNEISDFKTVLCVKAERAALRALNGGCHSPIGAYAVLKNDEMWLRICVASMDSVQVFEDDIRGIVYSADEAESLGYQVGEKLKSIIPAGILA